MVGGTGYGRRGALWRSLVARSAPWTVFKRARPERSLLQLTVLPGLLLHCEETLSGLLAHTFLNGPSAERRGDGAPSLCAAKALRGRAGGATGISARGSQREAAGAGGVARRRTPYPPGDAAATAASPPAPAGTAVAGRAAAAAPSLRTPPGPRKLRATAGRAVAGRRGTTGAGGAAASGAAAEGAAVG